MSGWRLLLPLSAAALVFSAWNGKTGDGKRGTLEDRVATKDTEKATENMSAEEEQIAALTSRLQQVEAELAHRQRGQRRLTKLLGAVREEPNFSEHPDWQKKFSEWKETWWPIVGGCFAFVCTLLLVGSIDDAVREPTTKLTWGSNPIMMLMYYVRESDTFKQLCPYNPWMDPGQAPSPNPYRLVAIVGPNVCNAIKDNENDGGFKWTLPTMGGYIGIVITTCLVFIMQMYFPWKLVTSMFNNGEFIFQGFKTVHYYGDNLGAVFLDLVPLTVMSAKFFVQVEDKIRGEFNQCLFLYRYIVDSECSQRGRYIGVPRWWSFLWISISMGINTYIAVLMTFYVVLSICTQSGDLMGFILSVLGSLGMIDFDDALMGALPQWRSWYEEHTARFHPQGGHWAGASADFFGGPESIKNEADVREAGGTRAETLSKKYTGAKSDYNRRKFIKVGIQLTNDRPFLGFFYSGNAITKVSTSGAAARAISMSALTDARGSWKTDHKKYSFVPTAQGSSAKGAAAAVVDESNLGQPTEREGLVALRSQPSNEPLGICKHGNYYGKRFPYLYCGKDFTWIPVVYSPDGTKGEEVEDLKRKGIIHATSPTDIGTDPVVKGKTVRAMLEARPWHKASGDHDDLMKQIDGEFVNDDRDYVLKGVGLEPGMCIWKINGKRVANAEEIKDELRQLKGDCLDSKCRFDPAKVTKVDPPRPGEEGFDQVAWNVKEFTMTLSVAGDEDSSIDDLFHGLFYTLIRILLLGSLLFIFCVYVTDENGVHVGV
eukprot:TRINITY_DN15831_c0_g1_i1.p1 TRINITY_DN15831_c0_g1~~TRINITY_DN15831_c0_g1_i1.p1  ORF type:complete len:802 (+),score=303.40 TRINITY_DN15831_c0_g1_i1:97-2406(+)